MEHYIYILIDPRTYKIKYVGKTINIDIRYRNHCKKKRGNSHRENWLEQLKSLDIKPLIQVIEICNEFEWAVREQYWIAYYLDLGCDLVNSTLGGEGVTGLKLSDSAKEKLRQHNLGRKDSIETRKKKSIGHLGNQSAKGNKLSIEARKKMSDARRGVANGRTKLDDNKVRDILWFISMGVFQKEIALMYGVGETIISDIKHNKHWIHIQG